MIYLIGGSSHVGKTLLAQKLMERTGIPYLSLDHLKMGFIRTGMTQLTVEDDYEMRYWMWPFVAEMIKTAIENDQSMIIEGCYIPSEWKDSFTKAYLTHIRCLFLVMTESYIRDHVSDIKDYANVIEKRLDDQIDVERLIACSREFEEECKEHGIPCYVIDKLYCPEDILNAILTKSDPISESDLSLRRAAVLIPIVREKEGPALLMEVRSLSVWQPGEICFPGGHVEAGESSVETALRETNEELGIPVSYVKVLKEMEPERHITDMLVHPVLAEIDSYDIEKLSLQKEEVGGVFTLPLAWLASHEPAVYDLSDPQSEKLPLTLRQYLKNYKRRGTGGTTLYWEYGAYGIWGLTARLLARIREHDCLSGLKL